jgi:two-component system sensor histidine kinase HydH
MKRPGSGIWLLMGGLAVTLLLLWFAWNSQQSARPVAQAMLQGLAYTLGQTMDHLAARDPSLKILAGFDHRDIAYFALVDRSGRIRFHRNPDLIGESVKDERYLPAFSATDPVENRVRLGTGEEAYEFHLLLRLPGEPLVLRLVLHTWQADQILNRARLGAVLLLALTISAWLLGFLLFKLLGREAGRREQMARQEQLARLGELGAVLAHEVRTPLAGIKGYAQLLGERIGDDRLRGYSVRIVQETIRLEGLVSDLLDYVRRDETNDGCVVLDDQLFQEAWTAAAEHAKVQTVELALSMPSGLVVACRRERMKQLWINLFSNALQATPPDGSVRVTAVEERKEVTLKIQDTGPGFTEEALPRVFDPFFTTRSRGSGLGLAVCRKIAEGCGGGISAANAQEGGAVITVRLPLCRERKSP